jgi:hypothetical protein
LAFERRALIRSLGNAGFHVLKMEDVKGRRTLGALEFFDRYGDQSYSALAEAETIFDPWEWSINRVKECNVVVHIQGKRIGSLPPGEFMMNSYTSHEVDAARRCRKPIFVYKLSTPFHDDLQLLDAGESPADLKAARDTRDKDLMANVYGKGLRQQVVGRLLTTEIKSVKELTTTVVNDLQNSHSRIRICSFGFGYFPWCFLEFLLPGRF